MSYSEPLCGKVCMNRNVFECRGRVLLRIPIKVRTSIGVLSQSRELFYLFHYIVLLLIVFYFIHFNSLRVFSGIFRIYVNPNPLPNYTIFLFPNPIPPSSLSPIATSSHLLSTFSFTFHSKISFWEIISVRPQKERGLSG